MSNQLTSGGSFRFPGLFLVLEIAAHQLLQQLIAVDAADERAGVVVVGDIRGVLGEDVPHELIDGVVALEHQRVVYRGEDLPNLCAIGYRGERLGGVTHVRNPIQSKISFCYYHTTAAGEFQGKSYRMTAPKFSRSASSTARTASSA